MKKFFICLIGAVIVCVGAFCLIKLERPNTAQAKTPDYLRIHIRANSNSDEDQRVKLLVKQAIVEYLTPIIANSDNLTDAKNVVGKHISDIENVANEVLLENGFFYTSNAKLCVEEFPTRSYGDLTLENGKYEALIINLGTGTGDNWWCVMFPPLCFVDAKQTSDTTTKYKSKLVEIIQKCQSKNNLSKELQKFQQKCIIK